MQGQVYVGRADDFPLAVDGCAFEDVLEFPDIAWKAIGHEEIDGRGIKAGRSRARTDANASQEGFRQGGQVLEVGTERRHVDAHDIEAVIQVLAEAPLAHHGL